MMMMMIIIIIINSVLITCLAAMAFEMRRIISDSYMRYIYFGYAFLKSFVSP
jgi:type IV secretory pathway VirB3-like protein